jgi:hypothetical protein
MPKIIHISKASFELAREVDKFFPLPSPSALEGLKAILDENKSKTDPGDINSPPWNFIESMQKGEGKQPIDCFTSQCAKGGCICFSIEINQDGSCDITMPDDANPPSIFSSILRYGKQYELLFVQNADLYRPMNMLDRLDNSGEKIDKTISERGDYRPITIMLVSSNAHFKSVISDAQALGLKDGLVNDSSVLKELLHGPDLKEYSLLDRRGRFLALIPYVFPNFMQNFESPGAGAAAAPLDWSSLKECIADRLSGVDLCIREKQSLKKSKAAHAAADESHAAADESHAAADESQASVRYDFRGDFMKSLDTLVSDFTNLRGPCDALTQGSESDIGARYDLCIDLMLALQNELTTASDTIFGAKDSLCGHFNKGLNLYFNLRHLIKGTSYNKDILGKGEFVTRLDCIAGDYIPPDIAEKDVTRRFGSVTDVGREQQINNRVQYVLSQYNKMTPELASRDPLNAFHLYRLMAALHSVLQSAVDFAIEDKPELAAKQAAAQQAQVAAAAAAAAATAAQESGSAVSFYNQL